MLPDTIRNIIAVGAGSFIGGIARYLVSLAMKGSIKGFPWATLLAYRSDCQVQIYRFKTMNPNMIFIIKCCYIVE